MQQQQQQQAQQPAAPAPTVQQIAAASQQSLERRQAEAQRAAAASAGQQPITRPQSEEERQFLPRQRLTALAREVCGAGATVSRDAEAALKGVAADFVGGAVAFAVAMARRRKSDVLQPADLQLYFQRTW